MDNVKVMERIGGLVERKPSLDWLRMQRRRIRDKRRKDRIGTTVNGKDVVISGLHKREHPGCCELCGKVQDKFLAYHHWDDSNPSKGMWLCGTCHWFAGGVERGLTIEKYLKLKEKINLQDNDSA